MVVRFLDLSCQYREIQHEVECAFREIVTNSTFIGGNWVTKFEDEFARYCGVNHCVGVGNGTDALEIAIEALKLPPGSEIIVPANSFIASAEAVTRMGHKVVFADCEPDSYSVSIGDIEKRITPITRAIIAVHLYGHPCDMGSLCELAERYGLFLIEDCAQSHGAEYKGKRVGSFGDISAFSFYPGKNLGAFGDAGAITTNNSELAEFCRMIANHGRIAKYDHEFEGRNSRLDAIQASILSIKLKRLDEWTARRIAAANFYLSNLADLKEIQLPSIHVWAKHVFHLFVIRCEKRDELSRFLREKGVQTGIHYPVALPKLRAYCYHNQSNEKFRAGQIDSTLLSLPIGEHLSQDEQEIVVSAVREYFR